jgi:thiol-disulfide isomerase/thioredoxin
VDRASTNIATIARSRDHAGRPRAASAIRALAFGCAAVACSATASPPSVPAPPRVSASALEAPTERPCPVAPEPPVRRPPQQITPSERVPEFLLATEACEVLDSRELVGKVPFVVVFFASWCSVCEHRVPLLREALQRRAGQVTAVWVTLDDAQEGWSETHDFLQRHALAPTSAVAGREFLDFALGYNPFRSVPVVVVVGRSGRVVAVQIGVREGDDVELEQALDDAIDQAAERTLFTSFPRP